MDNCSYFIKNKAIFGSYPTQESLKELEEHGVRYFIDLTYKGEKKIIPYKTRYNYISFPIKDRFVPTNWKLFAGFIIYLSNIITNLPQNEKLYINCKAGHGRSGIVVACLLCYMFDISPQTSLYLTNKYHGNRKVMKDKWRKIGSPQTYTQKMFVMKFFDPLYFYKAYKTGKTVGFSNFSCHSVKTELGLFSTSEAAYHAYKDVENKEYIQNQLNCKSPILSRILSKNIIPDKDWDDKKYNIMKNIVEKKFEQNQNILDNLLCTGLRIIIKTSKYNDYWGIGIEGKGNNYMGKILMDIRKKYYLNYYEKERNIYL